MELLEREHALARLTTAYDAAAAGYGGVVFVTGEPGIGKSALVDCFVASLEPRARVLLGACDDLAIPRPLGPFRDLIGSVSPPLAAAIAADAPPHEVHRLVREELTLPPPPTVLVLEDVHWADNATLDVATMLARRMSTLPALLVLTYRTGESPPGNALDAALGSIARGEAAFVDLEPLSADAVAELAGDRAEVVYAATGGNPFYVSELVECDEPTVPRSVASSVVGRVATLRESSRQLLELISVVPGRISTAVLDAAVPGWTVAAEEPERRHLLEVTPRYVRFRHELARHAVEASLPTATKRQLHARVLDALLETRGDPADIVHHAERGGAHGVVGEYALIAARRAAAVESNREAYAHYHRALDFLDLLPLDEQAALLEELTRTAYFLGRLKDAFAALREAIAIHEERGDAAALGRCTRILSRLHWFVGNGRSARTAGEEAVRILEPLGDSSELARAYSGMAQLAMLDEDVDESFEWGDRALDLAARLGDDRTRAHALVNLGTTRAQLDPDDIEPLLQAHDVAKAAGDPEEGTRALGNLAYTQLTWGRPSVALEYAEPALAYAQEHEVHHLAAYNATTIAWLQLRAGDWRPAEEAARREVMRGDTIPELYAKLVLTELAVRRGDAGAAHRLTELTDAVERTDEVYRIAPAAELSVELALLDGRQAPAAWIAELLERGPIGGDAMRLAAWGAVAGLDVPPTRHATPAYAAMQRCEWRAAADAFGENGWPYDRAFMLSLLDDADALSEALAIARELGAVPLAGRVTRRMHELGLRVPRGPRQATRENPANLTSRQLEVLALLADGRTNAEIADALVVSLRTAEHHVAAVLAKLGAHDRRQAARFAAKLGLPAAA